jgi:protein SCO1/2
MHARVVVFAAVLILCGCAKHYRAEGLVLRADPAQRTLVISHRPIDGFMPAMTMSFAVAPRENLAVLKPGTRIDFDLRVSKNGSQARRIRVRPIQQDIPITPPSNQLAIGAMVPDFALTDQAGRAVRLSDFRGRVVAIDFIYTRCPLPDVCPRLSANFAWVSRRAAADVTLLSITLDPLYDRPEVLATYARRYQADGERWRFLTGSTEQIRDVAGLFGLVYWTEEGSLSHTVATAVISRDGRLAGRIEGSQYRPEQLRDLLQSEL